MFKGSEVSRNLKQLRNKASHSSFDEVTSLCILTFKVIQFIQMSVQMTDMK